MNSSYPFINEVLLALDYRSVQKSSSKAVWENTPLARRILFTRTTASYESVTRLGNGRKIASADMPRNKDELLSQLQAMNWM